MKLIHLDRELVLDAVKNIQKVEYLKGYYNTFTEYDLGHTLYRIRSKFARMVRVFTMSNDNLHIYNHNKVNDYERVFSNLDIIKYLYNCKQVLK